MKYFIFMFKQNNSRGSIKIEAENEQHAKKIFKHNVRHYIAYSIHEITEIEFENIEKF